MGCCQTLAEAIENTFQVAMVVVFTVLPNIAANKWLSVWPLMAYTVFMLSFHNVFLEAFRYALGYEVQDDLAAISEVSETELLGAPANGEAWRKLQSRRALKVLAYLEDAMNRACLLAWLTIVSSVMRLHYSLFKHAHITPRASSRI